MRMRVVHVCMMLRVREYNMTTMNDDRDNDGDDGEEEEEAGKISTCRQHDVISHTQESR